jgi:hypothetical protein
MNENNGNVIAGSFRVTEDYLVGKTDEVKIS